MVNYRLNDTLILHDYKKYKASNILEITTLTFWCHLAFTWLLKSQNYLSFADDLPKPFRYLAGLPK